METWEIDINLHDCLSLGEVEIGFSNFSSLDSTRREISKFEQHENYEEVHRLPVLLRLLQACQPLAAIPNFIGYERDESSDGAPGVPDKLISEVVELLEDRAATYSSAESVQVVASNLAPAAARYFSRIPPLGVDKSSFIRRNQNWNDFTSLEPLYNTSELEIVLAEANSDHPLASNKINDIKVGKGKKRKRTLHPDTDVYNKDDSEGSANEMDIVGDRSETLLEKQTQENSEDSQQSAVVKSMRDLILSIVLSLKQSSATSEVASGNGIEDEGEAITVFNCSTNKSLYFSIQESILGESARLSKQNQTSFCDLPATLASILHCLPCIRHRHVSATLCRLGLSDTPDIINRVGANCPTGTCALISGCIEVNRVAVAHKSIEEQRRNNHHMIAVISENAVRHLSMLSKRESCRVQSRLRREGNLMLDLQLKIAIQYDSFVAASLLIASLSRENKYISNKDETLQVDVKEKITVRPLQDHIYENAELTFITLRFLTEALKNLCSTNGKFNPFEYIPWSQVGLFLKAYCWTLCKIPFDRLFTSSRSSEAHNIMFTVNNVLGALLRGLTQQIDYSIASNYHVDNFDRPYLALVACIASTCLVLYGYADLKMKIEKIPSEVTGLQNEALKLLAESVNLKWFSKKANTFGDMVGTALNDQRVDLLVKFFEIALLNDNYSWNSNSALSRPVEFLSKRVFRNGCFTAKFASYRQMKTHQHDFDPITLFDCFVNHDANKEEHNVRVCAALTRILHSNGEQCRKFLAFPFVSSVIIFASCCVHEKQRSNPIIMPFEMEKLSLKCQFDGINTLGTSEFQFLVRLFYCFIFAEVVPNSPFKFNPRIFPLIQVYSICKIYAIHEPGMELFCSKLNYFIDKECPEVRLTSWRNHYQKWSAHRKVMKKFEVRDLIRKSVLYPNMDPSGVIAENVFFTATSVVNHSELLSLTTSALLSNYSSHLTFCTYRMVCRDPLTMLKCSISVWDRPGLRRVALAVMSNLLETNEYLMELNTVNEEAQNEFIHARNEIVIRSLLKVFGNGCRAVPPCPFVCGLLRNLIIKTNGLAAMLFRRNLSEREVDWLVELVPEMMDDISCLQALLDDQASTNGVERLVVADSVVRLIVIHNHDNHVMVASLLKSALTQLLNGFFLITGATGGNVAMSGGASIGPDTSKIARASAFRLLKILQSVRLHQARVRIESSFVLQKFAGLCKGEILIGTLPTAITSRQKALLKDLLELAAKAADSICFVL